MARRTAVRIEKLLRATGRTFEPETDEAPPRGADTGPLADEPVAEVRGINVHAKQVVDGRDGRQLERLCQ